MLSLLTESNDFGCSTMKSGRTRDKSTLILI